VRRSNRSRKIPENRDRKIAELKTSNFDSHSKKWNRSAEAGDESRRSEGNSGFGNEYFSNAKNDSPAEAIEGVVKRIDLLGCSEFEVERSLNQGTSRKTASTGAVGQVVGGSRRQHASRRVPESRNENFEKLKYSPSPSEARTSRCCESSRLAKTNRCAELGITSPRSDYENRKS